jgi:ABC-2 type transport system ATP-binding protein
MTTDDPSRDARSDEAATTPLAGEPAATAGDAPPEAARFEPDLPPADTVIEPSGPGSAPVPDRRRTSIQRKRRRGASPASGRGRPELDGDAPIVTRSLTKRYGDLAAVDRLDLEVRSGEIYGLLGQNGAGKTTTILMLLGLTEPTSGDVRVVGLDPAREPLEVKRRVGYLPDSVGFYGGLTGRQNLRYTGRLNGLPTDERERRIDEVLELVSLSDRADDRADTYSRGMTQRLGIADALLKDPDILILDEPTTAIDPIGVVEILDLLRSLAHERGLAILLSSHLLNQVQSTCDRIGVFASGRLIGSGTIETLARRFGFPLDDLELALDIPPEETEAVTRALQAVPGVVDVTVEHGIRDERAWMLRTDPDAGATVTHGIIEALGDRPIVRLGRRRVELEAIYRKAVDVTMPARSSAGAARRSAA